MYCMVKNSMEICFILKLGFSITAEKVLHYVLLFVGKFSIFLVMST